MALECHMGKGCKLHKNRGIWLRSDIASSGGSKHLWFAFFGAWGFAAGVEMTQFCHLPATARRG